MPVNRDVVESHIISLIKEVSGRKVIHSDHLIGKDVGVYGWDGILLAEKIEEIFDLNLQAFIKSRTVQGPATWWDRIRGRTHGTAHADMRIKDLIDYVAVHAGEGENESTPKFF